MNERMKRDTFDLRTALLRAAKKIGDAQTTRFVRELTRGDSQRQRRKRAGGEMKKAAGGTDRQGSKQAWIIMTVISRNGKLSNNRRLAAAEKVKIRGSANRLNQAFRSAPKLVRTTFKTSREMDFFSEKELVTQTGHDIGEWPLVIVKELLDNALDACEEADIVPAIEVAADASGISVKDNGPGLPESTLQGAMDFTIRTSNREAYVSPCRGAQGNALKTLLPMPRVIDPDHGKLIVEAHGKRHEIRCGADPVSQRAVVHDDVTTTRTKGWC